MYLPKHNLADQQQLRELLDGIRAADLISATPDGLFATFLPLIYDEEAGALLGHIARKNDHWRLETVGEAMVIAHGPDGYISPRWYATKREHGKVVPTWNYTTAHIYGELRIHDDPTWVEAFVRRLTERYEADAEQPWEVDDAPRDYIDNQLRAIVGIELVISRVEAKAKLGQQRSAADVQGTIAGLEAKDEHELADATARALARLEARSAEQGPAASATRDRA